MYHALDNLRTIRVSGFGFRVEPCDDVGRHERGPIHYALISLVRRPNKIYHALNDLET